VKLSNPFAQRLSLRIWLAVVAGMAVLTLAVGWAWRVAVEEGNMAQPAPHGRELLLRSADGQTVMRGYAVREPGPPGEGITSALKRTRREVHQELACPRVKTVAKSAVANAGP
jgi:hypothetical protein